MPALFGRGKGSYSRDETLAETVAAVLDYDALHAEMSGVKRQVQVIRRMLKDFEKTII